MGDRVAILMFNCLELIDTLWNVNVISGGYAVIFGVN